MPRFKLLFIIGFVFTTWTQALHSEQEWKEIYKNGFSSSNKYLRAAIHYLRTGNIDIASLELEAFNAEWQALERKLKIPDSPTSSILLAGSNMGGQALQLIDSNEPDKALQKLLELRQLIFQHHKAVQINTFEDCIYSANIVGLGLWKYRRPRPDLNDEKVRFSILKLTKSYESTLRKCDRQADESLRKQPEYLRLMNNTLQSLGSIPDTLAKKDDGQLFRYLIELRSLDRMLYIRFG